jgi:hypothetical protein
MQRELPALIDEAETEQIPEMTFWVKPLFIPIKLVLNNFNLHYLNVDVSQSFISVNNETNEMFLTLPNVDLFVSGIYNYYIPFRISGDFNLTLTDSVLTIPIKTSLSKSGELDIEISSLEGNTSSLTIDVTPQGFVSKTFIILTKLWPLSSISNRMLSNQFKSISKRLNPIVDNYLNSYKYSSQVGNLSISGDYHFLSYDLSPLFIESSINGSFFLNRHLSEVSPVVAPTYLPDFKSSSSAKVQFTEYFLDSLMWALYASDTLSIYIRSQNVPRSFLYTFTTTGLAKLAPGLDTVYGKNVPVDMECYVYKVPNVDIQTDVSITAGVTCNFLVQISPSVVQNAFTVISTFQTKLKASLVSEDERILIIGSIDRENSKFVDFSIINSRIGNFSPTKLNTAFNWYVYYLVNNMNKVLEDEGILVPLPKGVLFKNPSFSIYQGAIEVGFEPLFT